MENPLVIAVVGAKGGCGTTLIAADLAAYLATSGEAQRSVCALDLDFARGDLAGMLDLEATRTLPSLLGPEVDATLLRGCATRHAEGFSVLGQPRDMSELVRPSQDEVARIIRVAAEAWEVVVLDVGSRMDDALVVAVAEASVVLLVTTPDVLAFRDLVRLRALLVERLSVPAERLHVVVNNPAGQSTASVGELAELAHVAVSGTLRCDRRATEQALASGSTLRQVAPHSALAQDLDSLWRAVTGVGTAPHRWHFPWIGGSP